MIVSSRYEVGIPQIDGRCYVVEAHTNENGEVLRLEYGQVAPDADFESIMQARAKLLNEQQEAA